MAYPSGVRVETIAQGKCLPIHKGLEPDKPRFPCKRHSCVEAVTGTRFSVKLTLTNQFFMCGVDGVEVHLAYDGGEPPGCLLPAGVLFPLPPALLN